MRLTPSELISGKCIFTSLSANINQRKNLIFTSQDTGIRCLLFFCGVYQELAQASDGWLWIWLLITWENIFHSFSVLMWLELSSTTKLSTLLQCAKQSKISFLKWLCKIIDEFSLAWKSRNLAQHRLISYITQMRQGNYKENRNSYSQLDNHYQSQKAIWYFFVLDVNGFSI